jgi:hypothetical protein
LVAIRDTIPGWLFAVIALLATAGAILMLTKWRSVIPDPVRDIISRMQKDFVGYQRLDTIVSDSLAGMKNVPLIFRDWAKTTVLRLVRSVPQLEDAPDEQFADILASSFAKLPATKQQALLPAVDSIPQQKFSVEKFIKALVLMAGFLPTLRDILKKVKQSWK